MEKVYNAPACVELGDVMKMTRGFFGMRLRYFFISFRYARQNQFGAANFAARLCKAGSGN
jgi:hypothetical protein